jgi:UPF0755 protein
MADLSHPQVETSDRRASPRSRRRSLAVLLLLIVLGLIAVAASLLWMRLSVTRQVEHPSPDRIITIEQGMATQSIIARLAEAGIVSNPTALKVYLRLTGRASQLKAGDYRFDSPISALEAIEKIRRGEVYLERVTIPEGFNRFDIAETLAAKTGKASKEEFLRLMEDQTPILQFAPAARNLEGYLFPDTYNYSPKTTPAGLVRMMVTRFNEVFTPEWRARTTELGLSIHQVITLASIIEEEARVPEERPLISSVFKNRLNRGMPLASDPTFIYAAILEDDYDGNPNQPRHRQRDSRYNTYRYAGLPPGPIASPGRASIEAALYPTESDYLYFVVNGTEGRHKFSRSASEHDLAVEEYRQQQREMRAQQQNGK